MKTQAKMRLCLAPAAGLALALAFLACPGESDNGGFTPGETNPIIKDFFTADPAAHGPGRRGGAA